jgi:response regulator of citrate/malate metabolism
MVMHTKFKSLEPEDIVTITVWYDSGWYSQEELAHMWGVSRSTIRRALAQKVAIPKEDVATSGPEVANNGPVGRPVVEYRGEEGGHSEWLAVAAMVALALWAGGIIYWVFHGGAQ